MTEQESNNEEQTEVSSTLSQKDDSNDKNKDAYFIIIMPSEEKIDFNGLRDDTQNKIKTSIIFNKAIDKENKTFIEEIVFKFKKKSKKKGKKESTNYALEFKEGEHTYNITFSLRDDCFVYQPELKKGNKFLPYLLGEPIDQDIIPLYNKLDIFFGKK